MKKVILFAPMFVLGFLTYWGFAWFCTDWNISDAPIRTLVGIIDATGEPTFCILAIIGSIGFPIYIVLYFAILRKNLQQINNKTDVGNGNAMSNNQTHRQLVGIRGWLVLPAIGLALSPILGIVGIILGIASIENMIDLGYGAYSVPSFLVNIGLLIYLCVTSVKFFKKRKEAPQTVIHFIIARTIASLVLFALGIAVIGGDDELVLISLLRSNNFIAQGIAAAIWIPYFKISNRVKATFVN